MKKSAIALAVAALAAAAPAPASALIHAEPGQHWVRCGRVYGHLVSAARPQTSCSLARNATRVALRQHPSYWQYTRRYGPGFPVRAYSGVTHKHYRLTGAYGMGELAIWNNARHIAIAVDVSGF